MPARRSSASDADGRGALDIEGLTAARAAEALRPGDVSPLELTEAHLARIADLAPRVNPTAGAIHAGADRGFGMSAFVTEVRVRYRAWAELGYPTVATSFRVSR